MPYCLDLASGKHCATTAYLRYLMGSRDRYGRRAKEACCMLAMLCPSSCHGDAGICTSSRALHARCIGWVAKAKEGNALGKTLLRIEVAIKEVVSRPLDP